MVDDNLLNRDVLSRLLAGIWVDVVEAENGLKALEQARKSAPDIIFMDYRMPEMGGFETCRRLKENELTKDIPIIFITAKTETEDIVKGFNPSSTGFFQKSPKSWMPKITTRCF